MHTASRRRPVTPPLPSLHRGGHYLFGAGGSMAAENPVGPGNGHFHSRVLTPPPPPGQLVRHHATRPARTSPRRHRPSVTTPSSPACTSPRRPARPPSRRPAPPSLAPPSVPLAHKLPVRRFPMAAGPVNLVSACASYARPLPSHWLGSYRCTSFIGVVRCQSIRRRHSSGPPNFHSIGSKAVLAPTSIHWLPGTSITSQLD